MAPSPGTEGNPEGILESSEAGTAGLDGLEAEGNVPSPDADESGLDPEGVLESAGV